MSNSKVRARRRRRANKAWTKAMQPELLSLTQAFAAHDCYFFDDVAGFDVAVNDWARQVAKEWAEKGALP